MVNNKSLHVKKMTWRLAFAPGRYAYIDLGDHLADSLLRRQNISVKFEQEFSNKVGPYGGGNGYDTGEGTELNESIVFVGGQYVTCINIGRKSCIMRLMKSSILADTGLILPITDAKGDLL